MTILQKRCRSNDGAFLNVFEDVVEIVVFPTRSRM